MKLAEKFHVPVITFIDTPGAWAGLGAEERGQSEAIARNLFEMSRLEVPIIATSSARAARAARSPRRRRSREHAGERRLLGDHRRGLRGDLWKDGKSPETRERAATSLRITAPDLFELRVIDEIIPEPAGGGHADHEATAGAVQQTLCKQLDELRRLKPDKLVRRRREKFMRMGQFLE
jgi:acetyl-CoA carboxylase carboxyl transferase subunit alpha